MEWMKPDEAERRRGESKQKVYQILGFNSLGTKEGIYSEYNQIKMLQKHGQIGSKIEEKLNNDLSTM